MSKSPDNPSINVYEVGTTLLAFQLWAPSRRRKKVIVHIDSTKATSGLGDSTLQGLANAFLCQILLLIARYDVVIRPQ